MVGYFGYKPILISSFFVIWFIQPQAVPGGLLQHYTVLRWITFVIAFVLFGSVYLARLVSRKVEKSDIALPLTLIGLVIVISGLINQSSLLHILFTFTIYLSFPLLYIAFTNIEWSQLPVKTLPKIFVLLTLLQIPEILFRHFVMGISGDNISFSLGPWGTFPLGIYCVYSICLILSYGLLRGIKWYHILGIGSLLIPAAIGEIKILFLSGPVTIVGILLFFLVNKGYIRIKRRKRTVILGTFLLLSVIIVLYYFMFANWETQSSSNKLVRLSRKVSTIFAEDSIRGGARIQRLESMSFVFSKVKTSFASLLFGLGPGSSLAGNFIGQGGILSELELPVNQFTATIADIGLVGLLLYLWMLLIILKKTLQVIRHSKEDQYQALYFGFFGIWLFYIVLGPSYNIVWRYGPSSFIFWFFAAIIHHRATRLYPPKGRSVLKSR